MARQGLPLPKENNLWTWAHARKIQLGNADLKNEHDKIIATACQFKHAASAVLESANYTATFSAKELAIIILYRRDNYLKEKLPLLLQRNLAATTANKKFIDILKCLLSEEEYFNEFGLEVFEVIQQQPFIKEKIIRHKYAKELFEIEKFNARFKDLKKAIIKYILSLPLVLNEVTIQPDGMKDKLHQHVKELDVSELDEIIAKTVDLYDFLDYSQPYRLDINSLIYLWDKFFTKFGESDNPTKSVVGYFETNKPDLIFLLNYPESIKAIGTLYPIIDNGDLPALIADCYPYASGEELIKIFKELDLNSEQKNFFLKKSLNKIDAFNFICKYMPEQLFYLSPERMISQVIVLGHNARASETLESYLVEIIQNKDCYHAFHNFLLKNTNEPSVLQTQHEVIKLMDKYFVELLINRGHDFVRANLIKIQSLTRHLVSVAKNICVNNSFLLSYQEYFLKKAIEDLKSDNVISKVERECIYRMIVNLTISGEEEDVDQLWNILLDGAAEFMNIAYDVFLDKNIPLTEYAYEKLMGEQDHARLRNNIIITLNEEYPCNERMISAMQMLQRDGVIDNQEKYYSKSI